MPAGENVQAAAPLPGLDLLLGTAGDSAGAFVEAAIGSFVVSLQNATNEIVGEFLAASTRPAVTAEEFVGPDGAYTAVASVSVLLLAGCVVLGVIQGLFSGEPGQAFARLVRDTPLAVLAIVGFPWLVEQLLVVTDVVADVALPGPDAERKFDEIIHGSPTLDFAGFVVGVLAFAAGVLVFLELVLRDGLVYVVTALAPLSFAATTLPAARSAAREVLKVVVATAFSKPAIFVALRVGLDLVYQADPSDDRANPGAWGQYLTGVSVLAVAAFMPFLVWKLLPLAEGYALAQGASRAPFRAATQGAQLAYYAKALGLGKAAGAGAARRQGGAAGRAAGPPGSRATAPGGGTGPGRARSLPVPEATGRKRRTTTPPAGGGRPGTVPPPNGTPGGRPGPVPGGNRTPGPEPAGSTGAGRQTRPPPASRRPPGPGANQQGWTRRPRPPAAPGGAAADDPGPGGTGT